MLLAYYNITFLCNKPNFDAPFIVPSGKVPLRHVQGSQMMRIFGS